MNHEADNNRKTNFKIEDFLWFAATRLIWDNGKTIVIQTTISRTRSPSELSISFLHKVGAFSSRGVGYLSCV